jgi:hypothetical protein
MRTMCAVYNNTYFFPDFSDDGFCKHVVAVAFGVSDWCRRHGDRNTEVCTDRLCEWDQPRKQSRPLKLDEIPHSNKDNFGPIPSRYSVSTNFVKKSDRDVEKSLYRLVKGSDTQIIEGLEPPSDDSGEEEQVKPPTVLEFVKLYSSDTKDRSNFLNLIKSSLKKEDCDFISTLTVGQADNDEWYKYRVGRLTASRFGEVMAYKGNNTNNYIVKSVVSAGRVEIKSAAITYGKEHETVAREMYVNQCKKTHSKLKVRESGLVIDSRNAHLGASPDGLVSCKCCGSGLLEIKCTYKYKGSSLREIVSDPGYHLYEDDNGEFHLKETSGWYKQIQGQLAIAQRDWCDFVLYIGGTKTTKQKIFIERIVFNSNEWLETLSKLTDFYDNFIVPRLLEKNVINT